MLRVVLLASLLCASSVAAKKPACPRGDAPAAFDRLDIAGVDADVRVDRGVARVVWKVTLENRGSGPATADLELRRDAGASSRVTPVVVDDVQIVGHERAGVADSAEARERFEAFTEALQAGVDEGSAVAGRRRSAVLAEQADHGGDVVVKVAGACSERRFVVVISGAVQATSLPGGDVYALPRFSLRDRIVVRNDDDSDAITEIWADGARLPMDGRVAAVDVDTLEARDDLPPLTITQRTPQRLRATGVLRRIDDDNALLQASYELPLILATPPTDLRFVFVVDGSVSMGEHGIAVALRQVQHLLDAAPADARWALIAAGRTPRVVVGPWRARDERFLPPIDVDNGSDVPAAIKRALQIAEDTDGGAARVIVLSDLQLKTAAEPALLAALQSTTTTTTTTITTTTSASPVVHVVELPADPDESALQWERGAWAVAEATEQRGGLHIVARQQGSDDEVGLARHLIAPTQLDRPQLVIDGVVVDGAFAVDSDGTMSPPSWLSYLEGPVDIDTGDFDDAPRDDWPSILTAGSSLRLARLVPATAKRVELRALAWATPVSFNIETVDVAAAVGSVINGPLRTSIEHELTAAIATPLRIVSAATSLVDVPRWRPEPVDGAGLFSSSSSCGCGCMGHGSGGVGIGIRMTCDGRVDLKATTILKQRAVEIAERCTVDFAVVLEVGDLEILDVVVTTKGTAAARRCVSEQWWRTRLDALTPGDGSFEAHSTFNVDGAIPWPTASADTLSDIDDTVSH